jgi:hypothetical protein
MMNIGIKSGLVGFAIGMTVAAAGVQAAVQATQHEHAAPQAPQPAASGRAGMNDMHAMMSDPVTRQRMMANMTQCRDMMSMMMDHMKHEGSKDQPAHK